MATGLLSRLLGRRAEEAQERATSYVELVRQTAEHDDASDVDYADDVLERAGKTVEDLVNGVETYRRRKTDAAIIAERSKVEAESAKVAADDESLRAEVIAFETRLKARQRANLDKRHAIDGKLNAIANAERRLQNSVLDPELLARERAALAAHAKLSAAIHALDDDLDHPGYSHSTAGGLASARSGLAAAKADKQSHPMTISKLEAAAKFHQEQFDAKRAKRAELRRQRDAVDVELRTIAAEKLRP